MPIENKSSFTGLILVSGEDRPGITESLMKTLSAFSVNIIDIEQLSSHRRFKRITGANWVRYCN